MIWVILKWREPGPYFGAALADLLLPRTGTRAVAHRSHRRILEKKNYGPGKNSLTEMGVHYFQQEESARKVAGLQIGQL